MKSGIIYITFVKNKKSNSIKELVCSVESVKKLHPELPITLFTDKDPNIKWIDDVKIITIDSERVKQKYLYDSPYDNTLYLDCDTVIEAPIEESFRLMERFDMAATHDIMRKDPKKAARWSKYAAVPDGFSEFGGGVVMFRKSPAVENFFGIWHKNFNEWCASTGLIKDQPSFMVSVWQCQDLKFYILPPEFNTRTKKYNNIKTRILHEHNLWR